VRSAGSTVFTHADLTSGIAIDSRSILVISGTKKLAKTKFLTTKAIQKSISIFLRCLWYFRSPKPAESPADAVRRDIDSFGVMSIVTGKRRGWRPAAFPPLLPPLPTLLLIREIKRRVSSLCRARSTVYLFRVRYRTHNTVPIRFSLALLSTNSKNTAHNGRRCS